MTNRFELASNTSLGLFQVKKEQREMRSMLETKLTQVTEQLNTKLDQLTDPGSAAGTAEQAGHGPRLDSDR